MEWLLVAQSGPSHNGRAIMERLRAVIQRLSPPSLCDKRFVRKSEKGDFPVALYRATGA